MLNYKHEAQSVNRKTYVQPARVFTGIHVHSLTAYSLNLIDMIRCRHVLIRGHISLKCLSCSTSERETYSIQREQQRSKWTATERCRSR